MEFFNTQSEVDNSMRHICSLLEVPPWQLGIQATSKGIIIGSLLLKWSDGKKLDCNTSGGVLVPQDVLEITDIESTALWILVIEKDAAFQKLLDDDAFSRLGPCIFITGKGYPDVNTRLLVRQLWEKLRIPVLILVDADPYGIEIMCVYRFGSLAMSSNSDSLACPEALWIGIHPKDILRLGMEHQQMTSQDRLRTHHLLSRPYIKENLVLAEQVHYLLDNDIKAEIEGVSKFSQAYLTDSYLPNKIIRKEWI